MVNPEAILQIARLTGRDPFYAELGISPGEEPAELSEKQRQRLRSLIDDRFEDVVSALITEAMASDDVHDRSSALAYLSDRLEFLSDLIQPEQRDRLTAACEARVSSWDIHD